MLIRFLTSAASQSQQSQAHRARALKKYLHQLYLRVHPDRLGQHPKEQAINAASFQKLQQFLEDDLSRKSGIDPSVGRRREDLESDVRKERLRFFAHQVDFGIDADGESDQQSIVKDRKVVEQGVKGKEEATEKEKGEESALVEASVDVSRRSLHSALVKLFEFLGLAPPPPELFDAGHPYEPPPFGSQAGVHSGKRSMIRLIQILAQRSRVEAMDSRFHGTSTEEHAKEGSDESRMPLITDKARLIILALQRSRGLRILFGSGLPVGGRLQFLLQRLAHVAEKKSSLNFNAGRVELDGSFDVGMRSDGVTLRLGACAADSAWFEAISSESFLSACKSRRARRKHTAELEDTVAAHLNLKHVILDADAESGAATEMDVLDLYHDLLEDLLKVEVISDLKEHLRSISVIFTYSKEDRQPFDGFETTTHTRHHRHGIVQIPLLSETTTTTVLNVLSSDAASFARRHKLHRCKVKLEQDKVKAIVRGLRLDSLRRSKSINDDQWNVACSMLLRHSQFLRRFLEGTRLVITNHLGFLSKDEREREGELGFPWRVGNVVEELKIEEHKNENF